MTALQIAQLLCLLLGLSLAATIVHLYWERKPDQVEWLICKAFSHAYKIGSVIYKIIHWVITLIAAYVTLLFLFPLWVAVALVWVTLRKITGEKATVTLKLS